MPTTRRFKSTKLRLTNHRPLLPPPLSRVPPRPACVCPARVARTVAVPGRVFPQAAEEAKAATAAAAAPAAEEPAHVKPSAAKAGKKGCTIC